MINDINSNTTIIIYSNVNITEGAATAREGEAAAAPQGEGPRVAAARPRLRLRGGHNISQGLPNRVRTNACFCRSAAIYHDYDIIMA